MLTAQEVKAAKPRPDRKVLKLSDSGGLQLHVLPTGSKFWRLAYRFEGRQKTLTIGPYPAISLHDARLAREQAKAALRGGADPSASFVAEGGDPATTFNAVATVWLEKIRQDGLTEATIEARTYQLDPLRRALGDKQIGDIRARQILDCLLAVHSGTPAKADRCRIVVGQVFRFAVASDLCDTDPTTALRGAMPAYREEHHAAATAEEDIKQLLLAINGYRGHPSTALALRLAPHVFLRSSEFRAIMLEMIDLDQRLIVLPACVMKGHRQDHIVPLSDQSLEIVRLAMAATSNGFLFPGARGKDRGLSENTFTAALRRMGFDTSEATFHGFRTTASSILHEAFPDETLVIEAQLGHKDKNAVRGAYNRAVYLDRRREMMQFLSDRLDELARPKQD